MKYGANSHILSMSELHRIARAKGTTTLATKRYAQALDRQRRADNEDRQTKRLVELVENMARKG